MNNLPTKVTKLHARVYFFSAQIEQIRLQLYASGILDLLPVTNTIHDKPYNLVAILSQHSSPKKAFPQVKDKELVCYEEFDDYNKFTEPKYESSIHDKRNK